MKSKKEKKGNTREAARGEGAAALSIPSAQLPAALAAEGPCIFLASSGT